MADPLSQIKACPLEELILFVTEQVSTRVYVNEMASLMQPPSATKVLLGCSDMLFVGASGR